MNERAEKNQTPELSQAEKERRFQELLKQKEELVAKFQEDLKNSLPQNDGDFAAAENAVADAADAALEAGNQAEHERLVEEYRAMRRWRMSK